MSAPEGCHIRRPTPFTTLLILLLAAAPLAPLASAYDTPAPDLVVASVTTPDYAAGTWATFSATIRNDGSLPSGSSSAQFSIDGSVIETRSFSALQPGASVSVTTTSGSYKATPGNHALNVYVAPAYGEANTTNNNVTRPFYVRSPDLVPTDISFAPASPIVGDDVVFYVNVTNQGDAVAAGFSMSVSDPTSKINLGPSIPTVPVGGTVMVVTQGWSAVAGDYAVTAWIDRYHNQMESNSSNDKITTQVNVTGPRPGMMPDLVPSFLSVPTGVHAGASYQVSARVSNVGNASAGSFKLRLEEDGATIDEQSYASLNQGHYQSYTSPPFTATQGNHTFRIVADATGSVAESNESNNDTSVDATFAGHGIDLHSVGLSAGAPLEGDPAGLNVTIENQGDVATSTPFTVAFYVDGNSLNPAVVSATIAAGGRITVGTGSRWTAALGTHNASVLIDATGQVGEYDESNNGDNATFVVQQRHPPADLAILDLHVMPSDPIYGDRIDYSTTITNYGPGVASNFDTGFYLTAPDGSTAATNGAPTMTLQPGETRTIVIGNVATVMQTGTYSLRAFADRRGVVAETNESNNEATSTFDVAATRPGAMPDLTGTAGWTGSPKANLAFTITATVRNVGNCSASNVTVRFIVDGQVVANKTISVVFQGGANITTTTWAGKQGTHTLTIQVDPDNNVVEVSEQNNNDTTTFDVGPNGADLLPTNVTSQYALYGGSMNFVATVLNQGDTDAGTFYVRFILDGAPYGNDPIVVRLGKGASTTVTSDLWTPWAGTHTLFVQVDPTSAVPESNEDNNSLGTWLYVG